MIFQLAFDLLQVEKRHDLKDGKTLHCLHFQAKLSILEGEGANLGLVYTESIT